MSSTSVIRLEGVGKYFGPVMALEDVSLECHQGEVHCLLGDNGAGKSTLIKILAGALQPDKGRMYVDDIERRLSSPADALDVGIATVFQELGTLPLMDLSRNFSLGREPTKGWGLFRRLDRRRMDSIARESLETVGISLPSMRQKVGTLSGGERQALAIARARHFGGQILLLDEPTAALGVREAEIVLRMVQKVRAENKAVILITHNAYHAYAIGDSFTILARGRVLGSFARGDVTRTRLIEMMAGDEELLDSPLRDLDDGDPHGDGYASADG